ncbi:MAG: hypothetical protein WD294_02435 [Phycisphaeraceae bacterium]
MKLPLRTTINAMRANVNLHAAAVVAAMLLGTTAAHADPVSLFDQGFETDALGWFDDGTADGEGGWQGQVTRVSSGTAGIASSNGAYHAIFTQEQATTSPFTRFNGYSDVWTGGFTASADIYLDTSWAEGSGFDYAVAANSQDNTHLRDFIFHVGVNNGDLLVGGSNNADFTTKTNIANNNHHQVTSAGWFTFEHDFYEETDGSLAVDLNLLDAGGSLLWTETRNNAADLIASVVGGNRYGWFTHIDVQDGLHVDNTSLSAVPTPVAGVLGLAAFGMLGMRRARRDQSLAAVEA